MKNKLKFFLTIFYLFFFNIKALSEEIKFDDIKFEASEIEYFNERNLIKAFGKVKIFLDDKTEISSDEFTYDRSKYLLTIEGDVKIEDYQNDLYITSNKINYFKDKDLFNSDTYTNIIFKKKYFFNLTSFTYDRKKTILFSETSSEIKDTLKNNIKMNEFKFEIVNNLIKGKNVNFTDRDNNIGKLKNAIINVTDNSII